MEEPDPSAAISTIRFRVSEADYLQVRHAAMRGHGIGCLLLSVAAVIIFIPVGLVFGLSWTYLLMVVWVFPLILGAVYGCERWAIRRAWRRSPPLQNELCLHFSTKGFRLCTTPLSDLEDSKRYAGIDTSVPGWWQLRFPGLPETCVPLPTSAIPRDDESRLGAALAAGANLELPAGKVLCEICRGITGIDDTVVLDGRQVCPSCQHLATQALREGVSPERHFSDSSTRGFSLILIPVIVGLSVTPVWIRVQMRPSPSLWQPGTEPGLWILSVAGFLLVQGLVVAMVGVIWRTARTRHDTVSQWWASALLALSTAGMLITIGALLWP